MTLQEMKSVQGPELGNDRDGLVLHSRCFLHGWGGCKPKVANTRIIQQLVAGMRWIWWVYGRPVTAWRQIERTGRFNSYPRPGTDDTPTLHPFSMCPVAGAVSYQDDFGRRRTTGGYHPHAGNDVHAPIGRPIRAPFDGLAIAHIDNWFAGRSVGLVGAEGFARNAHLSRFGHLGYVKAGDVIGYVGMTGDAALAARPFRVAPVERAGAVARRPDRLRAGPRCDRPVPVPEPGVSVGSGREGSGGFEHPSASVPAYGGSGACSYAGRGGSDVPNRAHRGHVGSRTLHPLG